jgi:hypothetical protein
MEVSSFYGKDGRIYVRIHNIPMLGALVISLHGIQEYAS